MLDVDSTLAGASLEACEPPPLAIPKRASNRIGLAVAITATFYALVIVGRLALHGWDPTFFVTAGAYFYDQPRSPQTLRIDRYLGYDGQFYYRLALHPFSDRQTADGMKIDTPPYRQQRLLLPILAHLLALGHVKWIPWTLLAVNYLAICALALSAGLLAQRFSLPPLDGLAIPFLPGLVLGLARDLTEPLAISLMVLAVLLLQTNRTRVAAATLSLAVVSRETTVVLAGALLLHSIWRAMRRQLAWSDAMVWLLPCATYVAIQLWMFSRWGQFPVLAGGGNVDRVPLLTLISFAAWAMRIWTAPSILSLLYHFFLSGELIFIVGLIALATAEFKTSSITPGIKFGWAAYVLLAAFFSNMIWVEDWSFLRACCELMALGFAILIGARMRPLLRIASIYTFALWLLLAVRVVVIQ